MNDLNTLSLFIDDIHNMYDTGAEESLTHFSNTIMGCDPQDIRVVTIIQYVNHIKLINNKYLEI